MPQPIQYDRQLFIPSLLGDPIRGLASKQLVDFGLSDHDLGEDLSTSRSPLTPQVLGMFLPTGQLPDVRVASV
jgi:hypothetical protein